MASSTDIVRQAYAAWNRSDWNAVFEAFAPEIEISPPAGWPEVGTVKGRDNVRQAFEAAVATMQNLPSIEVEELLGSGDHILAHVHAGGRGRGSGIFLEVPFSQVFTVRDGRIVRIDFFLDRGAAEQAVQAAPE